VATIAGIVMDVQTLDMWITDGQPDVSPFEHYRLEVGKMVRS
jgi:hypothetical protein